MKILVFNSGSSSIKFQLFEMEDQSEIASGQVARIGEDESSLHFRCREFDGSFREFHRTQEIPDHRIGMQQINAELQRHNAYREPSELIGIGHRMAHGGESFREPTLIDAEVLAQMRELTPLAPLHNPAMVMGIEVALARFPGVPQVAVFDTAFHHTLPPYAYRYAIPTQYYQQHRVRRYGFHGTSIRYVSGRAAVELKRPLEELNLIVLHLGSGCSAAALRHGASIDTSMGMTPLAGLMMGTRCGDLDPGVLPYLQTVGGVSVAELQDSLNRNSGLRGVCGENDMREIQQMAGAGNSDAQLALDMFVYRVKKYIGAYYAALGHVDALVFTGGIGENSSRVRADVCRGLESLGIEIDSARNEAVSKAGGSIQTAASRLTILVVPTDEQLEIAIQTLQRASKRN